MKKIHIISISIALSMILMAATLKRGTTALENIMNNLKEFNENNPSEKLYLHFDRNMYEPGENIWFNAYLTDANNTTLPGISEIIYVDLIDEEGEIVENLMLDAPKGRTKGDFVLPKHTNGGIYTVRAYTNWMRNEGEEAFFKQELLIRNREKSNISLYCNFDKQAYMPGEKGNATIQLFTTDGFAIANTPVEIDLGNNKTQKVATDSTGMLSVSFTAVKNEKLDQCILNVKLKTDELKETVQTMVPMLSDNISLQFFPEGGYLVDGIESVIAFKAINEAGIGMEVEGELKNEKGKTVATFKSIHNGMGMFEFTPKANSKYTATINYGKNKSTVAEFPAVLTQGFVLSLTEKRNDKLGFTVKSNAFDKGILVGTHKGNVIYSQEVNLENNTATIEVETANLPMGIAQFTLFNEWGAGQCERLVFLNEHKRMNIEITSVKNNYKTRDKVEMQIKTTDYKGNAIPADLSLSVYNSNYDANDIPIEQNIISYLEMSAELKGFIENPASYFTKDAQSENLDLVMLTHGWRRFNWDEVMNYTRVNTFFPEKRHIVSGIVKTKNGKIIKNPEILVINELTGDSAIVKGDNTGQFYYNEWDGISPISLTASNGWSYGYNWDFAIDDDQVIASASDYFASNFTPYYLPTASENIHANEKTSSRDDGIITINNVDIVLAEDNIEIETLIFTGYTSNTSDKENGAVSVMTAKDFKNVVAPNISDAISSKNPGVIVTRNGGLGNNATIRIRGTGSVNNSDPLWVVDGVPLDSPPTIPNSDIESMTILKDATSAGIYGNRGANGVIVVTTKRGGTSSTIGYRRTNTIEMEDPKIFNTAREFYSPVYDAKTKYSTKSDTRNTLYWNANVKTDKNGIATISFYTSDKLGEFTANAQGISTTGICGNGTSTIETIE